MIKRTLFLRAATAALVLVCATTSFGQVAMTQTVGTGWGAGAAQPELVTTRPVLGAPMTAFAFNCIPSAESFFGVSAPPASPIHIGSGLYLHMDPESFTLHGPVYTNASGVLNFPMILTLPPSLAGEQFIVQVHVNDPVGVLCAAPSGGGCSLFGFEVTNGVLLTLGVE